MDGKPVFENRLMGPGKGTLKPISKIANNEDDLRRFYTERIKFIGEESSEKDFEGFRQSILQEVPGGLNFVFQIIIVIAILEYFGIITLP